MIFKSLAENKKPRQGWIPNKKEIQSLPVASHVVIWFNTPVSYRHVTWQRIYAVCFTSTVPSLCRLYDLAHSYADSLCSFLGA